MAKYNGTSRFFSLIRNAIDLNKKSETLNSIANEAPGSEKYQAASADK